MVIRSVPKPTKAPKIKNKKTISVAQLRIAEKKLVARLSQDVKRLCSILTRMEWGGKCAMCGREGTAAHHFFGWKACAMLRYFLDNLVWLCFGCHIGKVHKEGLTELVRRKIIERIGEERFNYMYSIAFTPKTWTSDELILMKRELEVMIDEKKKAI